MSITYRYYCSQEDNVIYEIKDKDDPEPNICKNDASAISNLSIVKRPNRFQYVEVNTNGEVDFNNAAVIGLSTENNGLTEYHYKENNNKTTTSATNYQTKLELDTDNLSGGYYRIAWSYKWTQGSKNDHSFFRFLVDNDEIDEHIERNFHSSSSDKLAYTNFIRLNLENGVHKMKIEYATAKRGSVSIWNTKIELFKLT